MIVTARGEMEEGIEDYTITELLMRLIYDFKGFSNPVCLDITAFIFSYLFGHGFEHDDFEFVSPHNIRSKKMGWDVFKLNSLGFVELASISLSEKGKRYVEQNITKIDFSTFANALNSIDKELWGLLATYYYISNLSKDDPPLLDEFIRNTSPEQLRLMRELDRKIRSLIT